MTRKRFWLAGIGIALGLAAVSSPVWLSGLGTALVQAGEPSKADAVVVLAGDGWGLRIEKGAELVQAGYAPVAFVSGPRHFYGKSEADLAIDWAESKGIPRGIFVPVRVASTSTEDEAVAVADWIHRERPEVKRILLVTSNYHTGRSNRIWQRVGGRYFEVHTVAAPDRDVVRPEQWWATREGRKKIFFEWIKTITGPLGV